MRKIVMGVLLLLATASGFAVGCGGDDEDPRLACTGHPFTATPKDEHQPPSPVAQTLFLVDLASNDDATLDQIVAAVRPTLATAMERGGQVRFIVSSGDKQKVAVSSCLDGGSVLYVDRNNEATEEKAREHAATRISSHLRALLLEQQVGSKGTVTPLLADIGRQLGAFVPGEAVERDVILLSGLQGVAASKGDCLGLDAVQASAAAADALVRRCLDEDQFEPMAAGVGFRIVAVDSAGNGFEQRTLATYLADALCHGMTGATAGCSGPEDVTR